MVMVGEDKEGGIRKRGRGRKCEEGKQYIHREKEREELRRR